jgi:hypothetical protein
MDGYRCLDGSMYNGHFYVETNKKWLEVVCVNCGKIVDLSKHQIGEADTDSICQASP